MFGGSSSPTKEKADTLPHSGIGPTALTIDTEDAAAVREKRTSLSSGPFGRKSNEDQSPGGDKRRRSSTVSKAASFFTNAKNSLHLSSSRESSSNNNNNNGSQTPLQKLGKMDPALSVPKGSLNNSAGESLPTPRSSFRVGVTEDRNRKCRRTMEDTHAYLYNFLGTPAPSANGKESSESASTDSGDSTHVVETDNGYFAIFDGHAGTFAAEWCGKKLHLILEDIMRKNPNTPVPELLDQTFTSADQQLEKLPLKNSGCTAATAVLRWEDRVTNSHSATGSPNATESGPSKPRTTRQRVLYTANVGDARIILCRNGKALRLSYDHKGSDENEGKRITNAGGLILNNRVNGVLAVTRALGDAYLKDLVTGHPYTTETVIQPDIDEFLILACDGLWDVCTDQEAVDLIRHIPDAQEASKVLVDHALARFSTDNLSCMVIRFDAERHKSVVERRSDPIGVEGDQSSTKKGGVSEADKIVEGARKSMANAEISDVTTGLDEKLKEDIVRQASNEEPGPELSPANDQDAAANSDAPDKPNIKDGEEEKKS